MGTGRPRTAEPSEEQKSKIIKMYLSGTTILDIAAATFIPKKKVSQVIREGGIETKNGAIARSKLYGKEYNPEMIDYVPGAPPIPIEQFKANWSVVTRRFRRAYARSKRMSLEQYERYMHYDEGGDDDDDAGISRADP